MIVFDKLVVITLCIVIVNSRPSVVPTGVIVPSGITTVNDGRGISTTVVEGTPLVIAASPALVASPTVVAAAAPAPISTTVIETLGSNEIGESNTEGASDNESSSRESDESVGSSENVDESSGSSSDEGVEATEPSVDESVQPTAIAAVPAQPAEITANISPVPAPTVLAAPSTVVGTVPTSIASQSSTVVHSAAIIPAIAPSQAVITLAETPARSIAIQAEPLQILTVPRIVSVW